VLHYIFAMLVAKGSIHSVHE